MSLIRNVNIVCGDAEIEAGLGTDAEVVMEEARRLLSGEQYVRVGYSPQVRSQCLNALRYIRSKSPARAQTVQARAEAASRAVSQAPELGTPDPGVPRAATPRVPRSPTGSSTP